MKILITGGHGQLAYDCSKVLRHNHEVLSLGAGELDISNLKQVRERIDHFSPDVLINCAAYTKVDKCETEQNMAFRVNAEGPENLVNVLETNGGRLIQISTDYVFDGRKKKPYGYGEEDDPNPLSCYGKSKLDGETAIRLASDRHLIVRTAWLYGINGQNFLKTMLRLAVSNPDRTIRVVDDQYGSLTWTYRLAQQIETLIEARATGIFHATAEGYSTWFEGASYFLEKMDVPHTLSPCSTSQYPTPAHRPGNSILENRRLTEMSLSVMKHWQHDIDQFVDRYKEALLREVATTAARDHQQN